VECLIADPASPYSESTMEQEEKMLKIVRPSAPLLILMAVVAAMTSPLFLLSVSAEPGNSEGHGTPRQDPGSPPDPECWGEVTSSLAQTEDSQPGIGEHTSDPVPGDEDNETPRLGIGNNAMGDDTPAEHGATVSELDNNPDTTCEDETRD
jgi:hypothetical protein